MNDHLAEMNAPRFIGLGDPLPHRYLTEDLPGVGGAIKVRPEDFLVDELPRYDPCGEGEHLYLGIEKCRVAHGELMSCLSRHFKIRHGAIGFAGMKDKQGITRQTISLHLPADPPSVELPHERIKVLWSKRHRNKLRRGHLVGNRFAIRIRDVDALQVPKVWTILKRLERGGVPCYFGSQRFGYRLNNHVLGAMLLQQDFSGLLGELLGATGSSFPPFQRERREAFDEGRLKEVAAMWSRADRSELVAIKSLAAGQSPRHSVRVIGGTALGFWLSALQSAIFNQVLDQRLAAGTAGTLVSGDLAFKHDSRAVFAIGPDELADPDVARRSAALEIAPSGPLWGSGMIRAGGDVAAAEETALTGTGLPLEEFLASPQVPTGGRRPLLSPLHNMDVSAGADEHGHFIRTVFDLPRGMYATVVLREVMKEGTEGAAPA